MRQKMEERAKRIAIKARENSNYYHTNLKELRKEYKGKFIAIKDREVVASAENTEELLDELEDKEIKQEEVLTTFVNPKKLILFI